MVGLFWYYVVGGGLCVVWFVWLGDVFVCEGVVFVYCGGGVCLGGILVWFWLGLGGVWLFCRVDVGFMCVGCVDFGYVLGGCDVLFVV